MPVPKQLECRISTTTAFSTKSITLNPMVILLLQATIPFFIFRSTSFFVHCTQIDCNWTWRLKRKRRQHYTINKMNSLFGIGKLWTWLNMIFERFWNDWKWYLANIIYFFAYSGIVNTKLVIMNFLSMLVTSIARPFADPPGDGR